MINLNKIQLYRDVVLDLFYEFHCLFKDLNNPLIDKILEDKFQRCLMDLDLFEEEDINLQILMDSYLIPGIESVLVENVIFPFLLKRAL